jgi:hypothetical protein
MKHAGPVSIRRVRLLITISVILVAVFAIRLVDFQIVRAESINATSLEKREVTRVMPRFVGIS